jgi:polyferredoxin
MRGWALARRLVVIVLFVELGLLLLVLPWSAFWHRNYFVAIPALEPILTSPFLRGAISGLGLLNLAAAVAEMRPARDE